jgi:hypothetical protein
MSTWEPCVANDPARFQSDSWVVRDSMGAIIPIRRKDIVYWGECFKECALTGSRISRGRCFDDHHFLEKPL